METKIVSAEDLDWSLRSTAPLSPWRVRRLSKPYGGKECEVGARARTLLCGVDKVQSYRGAAGLERGCRYSWRNSLGRIASPYDAVLAFGVLATIRRSVITVKTKIGLSDHPHLVNSMLLELMERRCWTHAVSLLAGVIKLLAVESVAQKCKRNDIQNEAALPPDLSASQVLNVFFPEGGFRRLQRQAPDGSCWCGQTILNVLERGHSTACFYGILARAWSADARFL